MINFNICLFVCIVQSKLLGTTVSVWICTINIHSNFNSMGNTDWLVTMASSCSWHIGVWLCYCIIDYAFIRTETICFYIFNISFALFYGNRIHVILFSCSSYTKILTTFYKHKSYSHIYV